MDWVDQWLEQKFAVYDATGPKESHNLQKYRSYFSDQAQRMVD